MKLANTTSKLNKLDYPEKEIVREEKKEETFSKNPLISDECIKYLNYRIKQEELSSRLYLAMSMYLENVGYTGAAKKYRQYANEENSHADWARTYLLSLGIQPETPTLEAPKQTFTGLPEIIRATLEHEIIVTKQCNDLGKDAMAKGDFLLLQLVMKYQAEQIEEMSKAVNNVDRLKLIDENDKLSLIILDQEIGQ